MTAVFDSIVERMEQIPAEIKPFAAWLSLRCPHNVLEIGVRFGGTVALWHQLSTGRVVGVDWAETDSLGEIATQEISASMRQRYPRYQFVCGDSHDLKTKLEVCRVFEQESIDFLFLDGDHSFYGVTKDWDLYSPLVKPGGCVAFHDIVDSPFMRSCGHGVYNFWQNLEGRKTEFCIGGEWGGIGVIEL